MSCKEDENDEALCFIFSGLILLDTFDTNPFYFLMHFFSSRGDMGGAEHGHLNGKRCLMIEE